MRFACFGGAAAVADEAVVAARHRSPRRRGKFFGSNKGDKPSSSPGTKRIITSPGRRETDFHIYDMIAAGSGKSWPAPSSSALSTAASLDSAYSSSSSSSSCSSSRSSSSSSSSLEVAPTPAKRFTSPGEKRSPATGAAAVLVCLLMMMFCGLLGATLLTSAVLCFFPRTWPPSRAKAAENMLAASSSPEHRAASRRQAETMKTNAVMDGFLVRNRNK